MKNCIFCQIVRQEVPSWKIWETDSVYAFLDINPINPYHTLVIPKLHYRDVFDAPVAILHDIMGVVKSITALYQQKLGINNVQLINNSGSEAQQDVFHFHFHIIPRSAGDQQHIRWKTHPDLRSEFDHQIARLDI